MADYSSFTANAFNPNATGIFAGATQWGKGGTTDWSKILSPISKGGKSMFDPVTAGLAGLGALASAYGADKSAEALKQKAQGELAFGSDKLRTDVMLGRESGYGNMARDIGNVVAQGTWMPDLEAQRQSLAFQKGLDIFAPKQMALGTEKARRERFAAISPESKESKLFENLLNMKRRQAEIEGPLNAFFGPKAPTILSNLVI